MKLWWIVGLAVLLAACQNPKDKLHIGCASNLGVIMPVLIDSFQKSHPDTSVNYSCASSGKLYAQIQEGAPIDIYLSANQAYPDKLYNTNPNRYQPPFVYTQGRLALYSHHLPKNIKSDQAAITWLKSLNSEQKIAIANPKLAPYGSSAETWLHTHQISATLVYGDNIEQTFVLADTAHAYASLIAVSQTQKQNPNQVYELTDYPDIIQSAMIVSSNPKAKLFADFLLSPAAQQIFFEHGYRRLD